MASPSSVPSDDAALRVAAAAGLAYGLPFLLLTEKAFDFFYPPDVPLDVTSGRYFGWMLTCMAAQNLAVAGARASKDAKKHLLKVGGALWLVGGALQLWNASQGAARRDAAAGGALLNAAVGGLLLWRGYAQA